MSIYGYSMDPPAERKPIYICAECGAGIYDGALYYFVYGKRYCERCMDNALHYASEDDLVTFDRGEDIA
jgi:hypothetical protein